MPVRARLAGTEADHGAAKESADPAGWQPALAQLPGRVLAADRAVGHQQGQVRRRLGYPFHIAFVQLGQLERNSNYKFEDFISEVTSPAVLSRR